MPTQNPPAARNVLARFSRTTIVFAGLVVFDVLIWTAAALVH